MTSMNQVQGLGTQNLVQSNLKSVQNASNTDFSNVLQNSSNGNKADNRSVRAGSDNKTMVDSQKTNQEYSKYNNCKKDIKETENVEGVELDESTKEPLAQAKNKILQALSEKLGVSTEEVEDVLEQLGISAFDLFDVSNLTTVCMQLTGNDEGVSMLLDDSFQDLMMDMSDVMSQLSEELGIPKEQLMTVLDATNHFDKQTPESMQPDLTSVSNLEENNEAVVNGTDKNVNEKQDTSSIQENTSTDVNEQVASLDTENTDNSTKQQSTRDDFLSDKKDTQESGLINQMGQGVSEFEQVMETAEVPEINRYASTDTNEIINQIVDRAKITIENDTTSMEMQLNPENLGKIYLHVSSKEGSVHAQLAAQNENVKEALEVQLATLRENLNQAGIKVDEIEVTVGTHEFEQNLEQNANQERNRAEQTEEMLKSVTTRKNINLNTLEADEELSEEEALAAQMMKDNGNSVDFTA